MTAFYDLGKRVLFSTIAVLSVIALLYFSRYEGGRALIILMTGLIAGFACYEYAMLPTNVLHRGIVAFSLGAAFVTFLSMFVYSLPNLPFFVMMFLGVAAFVINFRTIEGALHSVACFILPICYILLPLTLLLKLMYSDFGVSGSLLVGYVIAVTKIGDIAAYFIGKGFGKYPLAPDLSPKKTWEGAFSAVGASVLLSAVFTFIMGDLLSILEAIFLGAIIGIVGIVGDLSESLLKRDAKIKDSNTLPGVGGVLDVLDSLLFTFPVVYVYFLTRVG